MDQSNVATTEKVKVNIVPPATVESLQKGEPEAVSPQIYPPEQTLVVVVEVLQDGCGPPPESTVCKPQADVVKSSDPAVVNLPLDLKTVPTNAKFPVADRHSLLWLLHLHKNC